MLYFTLWLLKQEDNLDAVEDETTRAVETLEVDARLMALGARAAPQDRHLRKPASKESDFSVADTIDSYEDLSRF